MLAKWSLYLWKLHFESLRSLCIIQLYLRKHLAFLADYSVKGLHNAALLTPFNLMCTSFCTQLGTSCVISIPALAAGQDVLLMCFIPHQNSCPVNSKTCNVSRTMVKKTHLPLVILLPSTWIKERRMKSNYIIQNRTLQFFVQK